MTFSIIVPCYNTEMWLADCLESIIKQNYKDWEMILINDGSIDNTENIMRVYAEKDTRIKVISQKNQGVSAARNRAVQEARGEYIVFLDSDDWYKDGTCLNQIAETYNNICTDIVVFRYQSIRGKSSISNKNKCAMRYFEKMRGHTYTGEEYLRTVLAEDEVYQWYPWLYAFRREFWIKTKIQFNKELWILEDMDILYQVILKAKKIEILDSIIYQYRKREDSATGFKSKESMNSELNVCINNIDTVNRMDIDDNLKKMLNSNFSYIYFSILTEVCYLEKKERKEIFESLYKNRNLMDYTMRRKNVFIRKLTYIFGIPIMAKVLFIRQKWKKR